FGVLTATEWNRVTKFAEKPATPDSLPGRPDTILASMGIYVFNTRLLESLLAADAANESSAHDFGRDVLPVAIAGDRQVFAYPFQDVRSEEHTSELQSLAYLVCRLLLEKKKAARGRQAAAPPGERRGGS